MRWTRRPDRAVLMGHPGEGNGLELAELNDLNFHLSLTGFDPIEIDDLFFRPASVLARPIQRRKYWPKPSVSREICGRLISTGWCVQTAGTRRRGAAFGIPALLRRCSGLTAFNTLASMACGPRPHPRKSEPKRPVAPIHYRGPRRYRQLCRRAMKIRDAVYPEKRCLSPRC